MARCKAIRAAFEAEIRSRNAREDAAGEKLEELVKNLDVKIESEIAARHQQVSSLKRDIAVLLRWGCQFLATIALKQSKPQSDSRNNEFFILRRRISMWACCRGGRRLIPYPLSRTTLCAAPQG